MLREGETGRKGEPDFPRPALWRRHSTTTFAIEPRGRGQRDAESDANERLVEQADYRIELFSGQNVQKFGPRGDGYRRDLQSPSTWSSDCPEGAQICAAL
jgi:hypothetical protein